MEKWIQEKRAKSRSKISGARKPEKVENGVITPEYEIKHSKNVTNLQDYVGNAQGNQPSISVNKKHNSNKRDL